MLYKLFTMLPSESMCVDITWYDYKLYTGDIVDRYMVDLMHLCFILAIPVITWNLHAQVWFDLQCNTKNA